MLIEVKVKSRLEFLIHIIFKHFSLWTEMWSNYSIGTVLGCGQTTVWAHSGASSYLSGFIYKGIFWSNLPLLTGFITHSHDSWSLRWQQQINHGAGGWQGRADLGGAGGSLDPGGRPEEGSSERGKPYSLSLGLPPPSPGLCRAPPGHTRWGKREGGRLQEGSDSSTRKGLTLSLLNYETSVKI